MGSTTGRQKRRQWGGPLGSTSKQITLSATILQSQEAGITSDPRMDASCRRTAPAKVVWDIPG